MAEISTSGLEELIGDLGKLAELPDDVIGEMLEAEAAVVAEAQSAEARAMLSGDMSKGITAGAITYDKKPKTTKDGKAVYVYPKGTRTDGNRRPINEVAFINEYGKEGQPARQFIRAANEKSADAATEAAAKVYDRFLQTKNL
jgi:HK97 gp10 family phage protein